MTELSPKTRALLASLAASHDPPPDAAPRLREQVTARASAASSAPAAAARFGPLGLGLVGVAVAWLSARGPAPVRPEPPRETPVVVARPAPPAPVVAAPLAPPVAPLAPPVAAPPVAVTAPAPAPTRVERDDLPAELRWIERAQTALAAHDTVAASAALRGHARAFPRGHLAEEREALGVQVLCAEGRVDESRRAAERFVARHPTSPQAARVSRTCAAPR